MIRSLNKIEQKQYVINSKRTDINTYIDYNIEKYKNKQMQQEGRLHQKIINLCKFINHAPNDKAFNILLQKSSQLGLPISPFFTKQRYIYNIALAAINAIVDYSEGFELAAIFLKDICQGKSYWDILHFLDQLKDEVQLTIKKVDDVFEKVQVYNIFKSNDINTIYQCHCQIKSFFKGHLQKGMTNVDCKGQNVACRSKTVQILKEDQGKLQNRQLSRNKNQNQINTLALTESKQAQKFINLEAEFIDLSDYQNNQNFQSNIQKRSINLQEESQQRFCIFIQETPQINFIKDNKQNQREINKQNKNLIQKQKSNQKTWQKNIRNLLSSNIISIDSQIQSGCQFQQQKQIEGKQRQIIQIQQVMDIQNQILAFNRDDNNRMRDGFISDQDQKDQNYDIEFQFRNDNDVLLLMDQPNRQYTNNFRTIEDQNDLLLAKNLYQKQKLELRLKKFERQSKIVQRCGLCLQLYHPYCQFQQIFICNTCFLKQNSLNYRVIKNLFTGYVQPKSYLTTISFLCPDVTTAKIQYSSSYIIEMRLQILDIEKTQQEDNKQKSKKIQKKFGRCIFYLNYQPIPIRNLISSSEIMSIKLPLKFLQQKNTLIIEKIQNKNVTSKNRKNVIDQKNSHLLLVGIYKVVPKSKRKQIIKNSVTQVPAKSMKFFYQSLLNQSKQNYLKISTLSFLTGKPMSFPIRSFQCRHPECFDYSELASIIYPKKQRIFTRRPKNTKTPSQKQKTEENKKLEQLKQKIIKKTGKKSMKILCPKCNVVIKGFYIDTLIKDSIEQNNLKQKRYQNNFIQFFDDKQPQNLIEILSQSDKNQEINVNMVQEEVQQVQTNELLYQNIKPAILFRDSSSQESSSQQYKKWSKSSRTKKIFKKSKQTLAINRQIMTNQMNKRSIPPVTEVFQIQSSMISIQEQSEYDSFSACKLYILSKRQLRKQKAQMKALELREWQKNNNEVLICDESHFGSNDYIL